MKRGEGSASGIYRDLFDAVEGAMADGEIDATASLYRSVSRSWRAAAYVLERRYGWGKDGMAKPEREEYQSDPLEVGRDYMSRTGINLYDRGSVLRAIQTRDDLLEVRRSRQEIEARGDRPTWKPAIIAGQDP